MIPQEIKTRLDDYVIEQDVAKNIIFARGAEGSVLTTSEGSWLATAAKVQVVSKVGAGDSYVGAFTLALSDAMKVGAIVAMLGAAISVLRKGGRHTPEGPG